MTISTQQRKTVLKMYNKQLKLAGLNRRKQKTSPQPRKEEVTISLEGKKQQIYRRTANHIVEKLTKK